MMATRLSLICSGITDAMRRGAFPDDGPLDPRSTQLAKELRGRMPLGPTRLLCGPSLRARQTADLLGLTPAISEAARDQDYGDWAGLTLAALEADHPGVMQAWISDPLFAPAGGESLRDLRNRADVFLNDLAVMPGTTIVVTHGAVVRAIVLIVLEAPVQSFWHIDTPPLSTVNLTHDGRRWAVRLGVNT